MVYALVPRSKTEPVSGKSKAELLLGGCFSSSGVGVVAGSDSLEGAWSDWGAFEDSSLPFNEPVDVRSSWGNADATGSLSPECLAHVGARCGVDSIAVSR